MKKHYPPPPTKYGARAPLQQMPASSFTDRQSVPPPPVRFGPVSGKALQALPPGSVRPISGASASPRPSSVAVAQGRAEHRSFASRRVAPFGPNSMIQASPMMAHKGVVNTGKPLAPPLGGRPKTRSGPIHIIQRVTIPDTHKLDDAKRYVRWREYHSNPEVSHEGHRVGTCYICKKKERMKNMEVDHIIPENFLRALLDLWKIHQNIAEDIADTLELNWTKTKQYDFAATDNAYNSYRDKYENVDKVSSGQFVGKLYEVLQDTTNLDLICSQCNAMNVKSDRLLRADYTVLQANYNLWDPTGKAAIKSALGKWIGTNYHLNPAVVMQDFGTPPNSPAYGAPTEVDL
jgi:hypothetical protein